MAKLIKIVDSNYSCGSKESGVELAKELLEMFNNTFGDNNQEELFFELELDFTEQKSASFNYFSALFQHLSKTENGRKINNNLVIKGNNRIKNRFLKLKPSYAEKTYEINSVSKNNLFNMMNKLNKKSKIIKMAFRISVICGIWALTSMISFPDSENIIINMLDVILAIINIFNCILMMYTINVFNALHLSEVGQCDIPIKNYQYVQFYQFCKNNNLSNIAKFLQDANIPMALEKEYSNYYSLNIYLNKNKPLKIVASSLKSDPFLIDDNLKNIILHECNIDINSYNYIEELTEELKDIYQCQKINSDIQI